MIICLTSLARAGKDTFADYLVDKYGFIKLNMSDVLRDELKAQGKEGTKEEMSLLGDEWRKLNGMDVVMKRTLEKAKQYDKVIITGVRSIEELSRGNRCIVRCELRSYSAQKEGMVHDMYSYEK